LGKIKIFIPKSIRFPAVMGGIINTNLGFMLNFGFIIMNG